jgi:hypothetical protein
VVDPAPSHTLSGIAPFLIEYPHQRLETSLYTLEPLARRWMLLLKIRHERLEPDTVLTAVTVDESREADARKRIWWLSTGRDLSDGPAAPRARE